MTIPWVTIRVSDLTASKRFYGEFLGLPLRQEFSPTPGITIAFFGAENETQVELIRDERQAGSSAARSNVSVGISSANFDALLLRTREQALVTVGPMLLGGHTECFFVSDPDGVGVQIIRADGQEKPMEQSSTFWQALETLVGNSELVIDRPRGSAHPKYPGFIYPVDYGYLSGTASMDGGGIDVWSGTRARRQIDAVVCTVDLLKRDSEIKILIGCTEAEKTAILALHNSAEFMKGVLVRRWPDDQARV